MVNIYIDKSIQDHWVANYLNFINDDWLQNQHLKYEKSYRFMNDERQVIRKHVNNFASHLLPLVDFYPEIRNFLDTTTSECYSVCDWLDHYRELLPVTPINQKHLQRMEVSSVKDYDEWIKNWPSIPEEHMRVFVNANSELMEIILAFIPVYKTYPHTASGIVSFVYDKPKEFGMMLYAISENFKSGRYKKLDLSSS